MADADWPNYPSRRLVQQLSNWRQSEKNILPSEISAMQSPPVVAGLILNLGLRLSQPETGLDLVRRAIADAAFDAAAKAEFNRPAYNFAAWATGVETAIVELNTAIAAFPATGGYLDRETLALTNGSISITDRTLPGGAIATVLSKTQALLAAL